MIRGNEETGKTERNWKYSDEVITVSLPDETERQAYILWFIENHADGKKLCLWKGVNELASSSAGLSMPALSELLIDFACSGKTMQPTDVLAKIESCITSQLGEGVVEFKNPEHKLRGFLGNKKLKKILRKRLIPGLKKRGKALGCGKSFIFEAFASMLEGIRISRKSIRN